MPRNRLKKRTWDPGGVGAKLRLPVFWMGAHPQHSPAVLPVVFRGNPLPYGRRDIQLRQPKPDGMSLWPAVNPGGLAIGVFLFGCSGASQARRLRAAGQSGQGFCDDGDNRLSE